MSRILIVGNNIRDRETLGLIIEFRGHTCATTGYLEEAVNLLQKGFFDLVVTDFNTARNNTEILKRLKRNYGDLPVIVLTPSGESVEGADETIAIPCSPEILTSGVESALGKLIALKAKSRREKRRFARYLIELPCWVRDVRGNDKVAGRTMDISRDGVYIVTTGEWKAGTRIECLIQLSSSTLGEASKAIRGEGRIVRTVVDSIENIGIGASIERHEFVDLVTKRNTV